MFLKYLISYILLLSYIFFCVSENTDVGLIEFCNDHRHSRRLLLVSTLDGRLSALNIDDSGSEKWSIATEPGPLLSSTIHHLELSENSHLVRIIPSLSGGLYKFDGESIEPMPANTDSLLKSYWDNIDISGGKEVRSYAVDIETGKILYECSMNECSNWTENTYVNYDMILLRRETQKVRAIELQSRSERWNYSVGLHNVTITRSSAVPNCRTNSKEPLDVEIKVVMPKGLLTVTDKSNPKKVLWEHQFSSPVVSSWTLVGRQLEWIDLFKSAESINIDKKFPAYPTLYIGAHHEQLYIQESEPLYKNHLFFEKSRLSMKKYKLIHTSDINESDVLQIADKNENTSITALAMLYDSEYMSGEGYYLYCEDINGECQSKKSGFVSITSFFNWWKEATAIFLVTLCLLNYWIPYSTLTAFNFIETIKGIYNKIRNRYIIKESTMEESSTKSDSGISGAYCRTSSEFETSSSYKSRYLDDFEPIHCLGKGGFGVVFQAKHKVDGCHYAIKRITLPNKEEARERVMREVKALAKLEHPYIVRYCQSWQECPPIGWQEEQDELWRDKTRNEYLSSEPEVLSEESYTHSSVRLKKHVVRNVKTDNSCSIVFEDTRLCSDSQSVASESVSAAVNQRKQNKRRKSDNKVLRVYLYIQMQLCQKNSLREWLADNLDRNCNNIVNMFDQIVQAVEYVHLQGLIHRDLKPSNIFFSPDGQIKVGDFGLVTEIIADSDVTLEYKTRRVHDETRTANVGTELYMSPEQLANKSYNFKVDIYSLGIIFFELLISFKTQMERYKVLSDLRKNIFPANFHVKHKYEYDLLVLMLSSSPEKRPTANEIKSRPPLINFRGSEGSLLQDLHVDIPFKNNVSSNILQKNT